MKKILFLLSFFLPVYLFSISSQFCSNGTIDNYGTFVSGFVCNDIFYVTDGVVIYHDVNHLSQSYPPNVNVNVKSSDLITLTYGHSEGNDFVFNGYNYVSSTSCPDGDVLNVDTGICETPVCPVNSSPSSTGDCVCDPGYVDINGSCVNPCVGFNPPSSKDGLLYVSYFSTENEAINYASSHNILNAVVFDGVSLGANSGCSLLYLYGTPKSNYPCLSVTPPLTDENGYPLQAGFDSYRSCINYINQKAGGNGSCKTFGSCSKAFGYYNSDTNSSYDGNNTLSYYSNENNYTTPTYTDTVNTSGTNLDPLLTQNAKISDLSHNDRVNIANKLDSSNTNLHNIKTNIGQLTSQNHSDLLGLKSSVNSVGNDIKSKLSDIHSLLSDTGPDLTGQTDYEAYDYNISYDTSSLFDFFDNFQTAWNNLQADFDSVKAKGDALKSLLENDRDNGVTLTLPHATVTTCPYTTVIDFSSIDPSLVYNVDVDFCKPFSTLYPVFYTIFSIMFTIFIIGFAFKSLMRLL